MSQMDDPFRPLDATTVVRPRPGAGKRTPGETAVQRPAPGQRLPRDPSPAPVREVPGDSVNPLVTAAAPLLALAGQLRSTAAAPDVAALRRHTLEEIRRFEAAARTAGVSNEVVLAARYALGAALDEALLSTPWGADSEWAQQTLLVTLDGEAWRGESFFKVLDGLVAGPARHIDLIELQYLCIAFGFAGKYQVRDGGRDRLLEIEQSLYDVIRRQRETPQP